MLGEFSVIDKYFKAKQTRRSDVLLSLGDDCALLTAPAGQAIAISTDTLVAGTHFLADASPQWVAHKALASNISDLAAMGAKPAWVSLALTLPCVDQAWLEGFSDGFFSLANAEGIELIGGDTTKGPLSITLTIQGFVEPDKALTRSGAKVGDGIYVSGTLGDSLAGLDVILSPTTEANRPFAKTLEARHYLSCSRIALGQELKGLAHSAIDISDGLVADLNHILRQSSVGAKLFVDQLPISRELSDFLADETRAQQYALTSGEEYELCFTMPMVAEAQLEAALAGRVRVTKIGEVVQEQGLVLFETAQNPKASSVLSPLNWSLEGYDHFLVG